eukprot:CAMPEP_0183309530 /NCGR_PEP_ID=MMETSP0160_2-20130417/25399_1 /TAXON_ID=2839 ORGANISM="Odontella Sinensis, Strain Grunow 1884" /NCGR_SAMPLE_ID=MMETSP0160_2 /ASSEMBLY_ACC=CAM_ASM_000250 /LENGTH=413 /DNA_ID=CAMNT_0025473575 /DNA_START=57 /DNA_END=1298 /DNA_ORIENTATION=+
MKYTAAILVALGASAAGNRAVEVSPPSSGISAESDLGQSLLSKARRLENEDEEISFTWVKDYSLKFQGCHHVASWNDEADDENDVRVMTKRVVRFRLCPSDQCGSNAMGCRSGYGDYIVDLATYAKAYWESKRRMQERNCEIYLWKNCDCDEDDGQDRGDDFNPEYCEYDCFADAGMDQCIDRNPYSDDEDDGRRDELDRYMECEELEIENNNRRKLEDQDEDEEYFVGPYCADGGAKVFLGLFTDDECTNFADDDGGQQTYETLMGESLPYGAQSVIGMDCVSCEEPEEVDEMKEKQSWYELYGNYDYYEGNDRDDEDRVADQCEQVYEIAGKCEVNLADGVTNYPVDNACDYIEGIRITYQNEKGIIVGYKTFRSTTHTVFIVLFALSTVALGGYVMYLRKRLGYKINLDS